MPSSSNSTTVFFIPLCEDITVNSTSFRCLKYSNNVVFHEATSTYPPPLVGMPNSLLVKLYSLRLSRGRCWRTISLEKAQIQTIFSFFSIIVNLHRLGKAYPYQLIHTPVHDITYLPCRTQICAPAYVEKALLPSSWHRVSRLVVAGWNHP